MPSGKSARSSEPHRAYILPATTSRDQQSGNASSTAFKPPRLCAESSCPRFKESQQVIEDRFKGSEAVLDLLLAFDTALSSIQLGTSRFGHLSVSRFTTSYISVIFLHQSLDPHPRRNAY